MPHVRHDMVVLCHPYVRPHVNPLDLTPTLSKGEGVRQNAVTPAFMLGIVECVCLLAFKPECIF